MQDGFLKVGSATPEVRVADCEYNAQQIIKEIDVAAAHDVKLLVLPELCITGYTCSDLFLQHTLLEQANEQLIRIRDYTKGKDMIVLVGSTVVVDQKLYNCGVFIQSGEILGVIPKTHLPNYSEFYEARHFVKGSPNIRMITIGGQEVPFGTNLLFECREQKELVIGCEICEDLWVPMPPSTRHALAGATVICNLSASVETTVKESYRRDLVKGQSGRLVCGYIYADAGEGESTTDVVYSAHNLICENGSVLKEAKRFKNESVYTELDLEKISVERRRMNTFFSEETIPYYRVFFSLDKKKTTLTRIFPKTPFIPSSKEERDKRCEEILTIQSMGLKKRLKHTRCEHVVIGISGGLDSTLALLVAVRAFDALNLSRENIICVTMPCFGTTDRTYQNAVILTKKLGATLKEVRIMDAVLQHFKDIGHDIDNHDVTYENSQARERTQILMDIANQYNGLVVGTGDMSELALGWATYNGDHMSMYGVNASVPKTLVRHLVKYCADTAKEKVLTDVLLDVLDTPVSPELLPPVDGDISQKTEDLVGPYELHDFFLYYMMRFGFSPTKMFRIACISFEGIYDWQTIYKWLRTFYWRFFSQQFKRSCIPDGPKVGSVALSPRGDLRMPSDASADLWMKEMDRIKEEMTA